MDDTSVQLFINLISTTETHAGAGGASGSP